MNQVIDLTPVTETQTYKRGGHFAAGVAAYRQSEPRTLPSYFLKNNQNTKAWLAGWDYGKLLTAPPAQQSFEQFRENTIVVNVRQRDDGTWELGWPLNQHADEAERQRRRLLAEYERRAPGNGEAILEQFERTLTDCNPTGDVVILSGHPCRGKHLLLNSLLVTPPDLLHRVHDSEIAHAALNGDAVHVPESEADPRDSLLAARQRASAALQASA